MTLIRFLARLYFSLKFLWLLVRSGWTTPNTASAGSPISAADYNTYVSNNLAYLFSQRPSGMIVREGAADYTVGGAAWTDVDATNLSFTKTIASGRVQVTYSLLLGADNTASSSAEIDIIYGPSPTPTTRVGGTHGLFRVAQNTIRGVGGTVQITGLAAGAYVFRLQFRNVTGGATTTIYNNGYPVVMTILEI